MKMHGFGAVDYTTLSNSALDDAYALSFASGDSQAYTAAGIEIIDRLATPVGAADSLMTALFGGSSFPKYDAIQASGKTTAGFIASDTAQQAVLTESGNLITQAEAAAKGIGSGIMIVALAAGAIALAYLMRKR